ncbi:2,3-diaminopropionate biosynthesis protein SbnA [Roseimaritima ulvae]|uniref:N-(2-amino-2-carboxyethyl)-L-glutamate synthase n=1 Tax=Roseimaritima ulvae TaxID=980254 RepID=A0A5B9QV60_9BACT|nr:2,3-diaminopropionate biosynthesis protein SbnA [Roseimaritima ulvae]QEG40956.1 putative siderophore biosynthesis protein SbnA [Roseimaritima ulvae]
MIRIATNVRNRVDFPPANRSGGTGILHAIGDTPLLRMERYLDRSDVQLLIKLESANPGGSAKDRPARQMIEDALERGEIDDRTLVVESSSGNMGIGLAQVCRYYGLPFRCVVDPNAQPQNVAMMRALGAKIDVVRHPVDGDFLKARLERVKWIVEHTPQAYWPNQYANEQNPLAHQLGTVREIDEAVAGQLDYLFVATSSTGTARGCRDYLRSHGRGTQVVAVDAVGSALFGGMPGKRRIPGLGAGIEPTLARGQQFDDVQHVTDLDCVVGCRRMAMREACLVGGSAGGVLECIRRRQDQLVGKTCVALLHDSGSRYLDTVFNDAWVEHQLGCTSQQLQQRIESLPQNDAAEVVAG